ncbi:MAG TPA: radical SAM protein [Thermoplasmata archaeon]|nr:radical SAM protein [Thermoplasmata archaeon]
MKVREVACSTALSDTSLPGLDYALNPYRGCSIGCVYCYAPSVLRETRPWGRFVDVKRNIPAVLARELRRKARGVVGIGTVTDGYQPLEGRYRLTRYCLEQLVRFDFPVSIQTKSSLVLRDLDLLRRLHEAEVGVTITTLDEAMRRRFEPFASPSVRRIEVLRTLNQGGIRTWAFVGPILPSTTEATLAPLLRAIAEAGTRHVLYDRLRFRPGVLERVRPAAGAAGISGPLRAAHDDPAYFDPVEVRIRVLGALAGLTVEAAFPHGW